MRASANRTEAVDALLRGDPGQAEESFARALASAEEVASVHEAPFMHHRHEAHLYYAVALRINGRDREADDHTRRAANILESFGMMAELAFLSREARLTEVIRRARGAA